MYALLLSFRHSLAMARPVRIVIPELPHHSAQRGANCQDVFFVDDIRWVSLA